MSKMPHIQLDESIGATAAILPGDPARVDAICSFMTDVQDGTFNREYKSRTGLYKGRRILVISTGMGGASTAICVEELADLGVKDFIRIGSCGALQSDLQCGQLVICDKAVCDDGASQSYLDYLRYGAPELDFRKNPDSRDLMFADADPLLRDACVKAAGEQGFAYTVGPTRCHDAIYLSRKGWLDEYYSGKGIFASDMETAALFAVGQIRGVRTASILNVVVEWKKDLKEGIGSYKDGADAAAQGEENEIITALEALSAFHGGN